MFLVSATLPLLVAQAHRNNVAVGCEGHVTVSSRTALDVYEIPILNKAQGIRIFC